MSKESNSSNSMTFTGLLTIVFITLKLCNVINWSWWWVLSPIWGHILIVIIVLLVIWLIATMQANRKFNKFKKGL